ncbi:uncharacterized protein LOC130681764 [Manis pentadactyla]|uniref:uncharacterized protein LOC130681764 n=1 Tax=Manis pentadactyla TaxID=143292 RepID=UPI00255CACA2|nr:uncharacterized protein LOC130681764 [Manis pentadactyla]
MFEEQDHITVTLGDDSADSEDTSHCSDRDNSSDVVIIEDSDSELSENGLPTDSVSTDQPNFQGRGDNHRQLSQMPHGAEVLPSQGDQGVSQVSFPGSFKSYRSRPGDMEPVPAPNTRGSSPPRENDMKSPQDAYTCSNGPLSKKMKLKRRESNNGDSYPQSCCHVLPVRRQENDFISSIVGTYFRSSGFCEQDLGVIHLELKDTQEEQEEVEWERKWLLRSNQSSPAPSDITADSYHSCLCPDDTPEGTCSGPCSPGHGAHSTNSLSPSADSPTAVSAAQPAQGEPRVAQNPEMMTDQTLKDTNLKPHASYFGIPPTFGEDEMLPVTCSTA